MILAHVGKFLSQACHLQAKQRGVVKAEQFPQREQHRRAMSALLQALNTLEHGFQPALSSYRDSRLSALPMSSHQTKEKLLKLGSIVPKALGRLGPLIRTSAH